MPKDHYNTAKNSKIAKSAKLKSERDKSANQRRRTYHNTFNKKSDWKSRLLRDPEPNKDFPVHEFTDFEDGSRKSDIYTFHARRWNGRHHPDGISGTLLR